MKKVFGCLIFLLMWALCGGVLPPQIQALNEKATVKNYPDANTILLYDKETVTYEINGTASDNDEYYQKILTDKGVDDFRTLPFYYNEFYEKIEIQLIEIIKSNGQAVKIDLGKNQKVMIEPSQMASNIYDPANKILQISIPDLEVNDIIHVKVTELTLRPRMAGIWTLFKPFQADYPILYYDFAINAPKKFPIKNQIVKDWVDDAVDYTEKNDGDRIVYQYIIKDVPQIFPEPDSPPHYMFSQRLLASTAENWEDISRWYYELCRPHLEKITPEMRDTVAGLTAKCTTDLEKITAIFQFVSQKIRYMGVTTETEAPGYEPHDVDVTFNNRYGVCRDKAALLVAMLKLAGFEAYPVLFYAGPPKDEEIPNSYFNHAVTAVKLDGKYILMDSTDETTKDFLPSYGANKSFLVADKAGQTLMRSPEIEPVKNNLQIDSSAELSDKQVLSVNSVLTFSGINDSVYRDALSQWPKNYDRQFFSMVLKRVSPNAVLDNLKISPVDIRDMKQSLQIVLKYHINDFVEKASELQLVTLPELSFHIGVAGLILGDLELNERKFPFSIFSTAMITENIQLKYSEHYSFTLPEFIAIDDELVTFEQKISGDKKVLSSNRRFALKKTLLMPDEYKQLKENMRQIEKESRKQLLLSVDLDTDEKEMVILQKNVRYDFKDSANWTEFIEVEKEILSYAGVKNNSELKIAYNEGGEKVELLSAAIASPGKAVKKIDRSEINIMDQPSSGAAPAYPAGKIYTVSFPGVEVGSKISYQLKITRFNQPFFSDILSFADFFPVKSIVYTLNNIPESLIFSTIPEKVKLEKHGRQLIFRAADLSAVPREVGTAPLWMFTPSIFLATENSLQYSSRLLTMLKAAAAEDGTLARKKALELTENAVTKADKILAIRDFIVKNIRLGGPAFNSIPWRFSSADVTLKRGYANSADRAVLFYVMLEAVDISSDFFAVSSFSGINNILMVDYLQNIFSSIVLLASYDGGIAVLNENSQYGALDVNWSYGDLSLNLNRDSFIQPFNFGVNLSGESYIITLDESGNARIKVDRRFVGTFAETEQRNFQEMTPEERVRHEQSLINELSKSASLIGKFDFISNPNGLFQIKFQVEVPDFAVKSGKFLYFDLPDFYGFTQALRISEPQRRTPFLRTDDVNLLVNYQIIYPENMSLISALPQKISENQHPFLNYLYTSNSQAGVLNINCQLNLKAAMITPENYAFMAAMQRTVGAKKLYNIILRQTK